MTRNLIDFIREHAGKDPEHPAIIDGDTVLSYRGLLDRVERFAAALGKLDLKPTSKLGLFCTNQQEYLVVLLAGLLKGIPVIPYNILLSPEDLAFITGDAEIDILVVDSMFLRPETGPFFRQFRHRILIGKPESPDAGEGFLPFETLLASAPETSGSGKHPRGPGIPDVILYTSGTTARPKGVMLEARQFDLNAENVHKYLTFRPDDRVIVALPLFHSFGNIMAWVVLQAGGTLILLRQFAPKTILTSIARNKATILPLVPTIYGFLVELYSRGGYDVSSLRYCISGGAALPESLLHKVEKTLEVTVIEGYGLTETSPVIAVNTFAEGSQPGSVGRVLPNLEVKIADDAGQPVEQGEVGEICVRGETVMRGYWKRTEETAQTLTEDGWLKTGDLGHFDDRNRLYISAGRKKDLIIRAGENVSPLAIENVLMNHPDVAEAAAVGIADERVGERVRVCLVLQPGAPAYKSALKEFCRQRLPAFMIPDEFEFFEALPKNAAGKILKSELKRTL